MPAQPLASPATNADPETLVDWLELTAFFDAYSRARIDDITGSREEQAEVPEERFGHNDREDDRLRLAIEREFEERKRFLGDAYPFELGEDGEEFRLIQPIDEPAACFYLLCLVASHITRSPILLQPPTGRLEARLRNRAFQVMGTLAIAGVANGPAVSVGYPRETKETILNVLQRAEGWNLGMIPRDKPGQHAEPRAKDGGIDAIGWPTCDRPPPAFVLFGQFASGWDWEGKPAYVEITNFMDDFFDIRGPEQHNYATVIPFRVRNQTDFVRANKNHRSLQDRTRAPAMALRGYRSALMGTPMDEHENVGQIADWLREYRETALAG